MVGNQSTKTLGLNENCDNKTDHTKSKEFSFLIILLFYFSLQIKCVELDGFHFLLFLTLSGKLGINIHFECN